MAFDPLTSILDIGGKIIDKIFPDKNVAEQTKVEMLRLAQAGEFKELELLAKQIEVNIEEAKHSSVFVAGWRPFIGWVCGAGFTWQYVAGPITLFILNAAGYSITMPAMDASELMTILLGMLGLAGMRSYDKKQMNGKHG